MYVKLIALVATLAIIAGGFFYVKSIQTSLEKAKVANAILEANLETVKAAYWVLDLELKKNADELVRVNKELSTIRKERDNAIRTVNDVRLSKLAAAKPGLLTILARNASKRVWLDFEETTATRESSDSMHASPTSGPASDGEHKPKSSSL